MFQIHTKDSIYKSLMISKVVKVIAQRNYFSTIYFQSFVAEWDRLILYDGDGILMDNTTTGFSTIKQRAESILCVDGQSEGCSVAGKCGTVSCNTDTVAENLLSTLEKFSTQNGSVSCIAEVANVMHDLVVDIRDFYKKSNMTSPGETLQKYIVTTFKSLVKIPLLSSMEDVFHHIEDILHLLETDLKNLTAARNIETKNSSAVDLGKHVIILADVTARLAKVMSCVCHLPDHILEETYAVTLVTSVVFLFTAQTLNLNAKLVNQVGLRSDTASNICVHISLALEQYVFVIQRISDEYPNVRSLKAHLPAAESSLFEVSTRLRKGIGLAAKDLQSLIGSAEGMMDCVRGNKLLQESEEVISETVVLLFDVSDSVLAESLSCPSINGFDTNVAIQLRNILIHVHATFFLIANIPHDGFSTGDKLSMLLVTMNAIVGKIMFLTDDAIQSIQSLGDITDASSSSLMHIFEGVIAVATSVISSIALIFSELKEGSHSLDIRLSKALPHIMLITKYQIIAVRDKLKEISSDCANNHHNYQAEIFIQTSFIMQSFSEFKNDIAEIVSMFECNANSAKIANIDNFVGKVKSSAQRFSEYSSFGKVVAGAVGDVLIEVDDTLNLLSTISLEKRHVLKLVCLTISNYYFAIVTLNSIFNSSRYGTNCSLF